MNLIELGALGEFIGSVAVLITLIYLAIQMKQTKQRLEANTTAILGANEVNGNESTMRQLSAVYTDESMADLIMRAIQNLDELPPQRLCQIPCVLPLWLPAASDHVSAMEKAAFG